MTVYEKMTALANEIRKTDGTADGLTLDGMTEIVSGINTHVDEINADVAALISDLNTLYPEAPLPPASATVGAHLTDCLFAIPELSFAYLLFVILSALLDARFIVLNGETSVQTADSLNLTLNTPIDQYLAAQDKVIEGMEGAYAAAEEYIATMPRERTMANQADTILSIPQPFFINTLITLQTTITGMDPSAYATFAEMQQGINEYGETTITKLQESYAAVTENGGTVPNTARQKLENLPEAIRSIPIMNWFTFATSVQSMLTTFEHTSPHESLVSDPSFQQEISGYAQTAADKLAESYTIIQNNGGTIPEVNKRKIENLPAAIGSIPVGVEVKIHKGTFTTDSDGNATVTCGFKPDFVKIGDAYVRDSSEYQLSFCFEQTVNSSNSYYAVAYSNSYSEGITARLVPEENGVSIGLTYRSYAPAMGSYYNRVISNTTQSYVAIKYTE